MKTLIDFVFLIILYFGKFFKKWQREGQDKLFIKTLMYIYLSFLLYFTLMPIITKIPFIFNHPYESMNLNLFVDVIKTIFYTFLLSLGIELLQPLINAFRSSDITDILTNVIGGIIGYILHLIFKPLTIKILNYIKK